ncbi:MAG: glycosyltransferase family 39 protein [Bacteroidetes bacterium]|nr:glycosyltransferase family 39 protein [Bacteroidota bacterium]
MFKKTSAYYHYIWLIVIIGLFVVAKLPALQLPYFWDELGVYARAGLYLHDNGLGLLPKNLPPELSRGHPLLFSFIHGCGYLLFGDSVLGGHITGLLIAIALLFAIYYIARYHYNVQVALLAVLFTIVQPVFFAQSVLVLPEICLALFMLWAIHFWVIKKYVAYAIFATAAILVKETAVIIPVVVIVGEVIDILVQKKKGNTYKFGLGQLLVLTPFVIFIVFLIIQHAQNGWYFFPLHEASINFSLTNIFDFAGDFFSFIFLEQGRIAVSTVALILIIFALIKKSMHYSRFSIFLLILFLGGVLFNSINFFMNRYLLFAIIPLIIILSALIVKAGNKYKILYIFIPVVFIAGMISMYGYELYPVSKPDMTLEQKFHYDEDMSYQYYIEAQQQTIDYILSGSNQNTKVFANFPLVLAFRDTRYGFTDKVNTIDFTLQKKAAYQRDFDFAAICNPGAYDHHLPAGDSLQIIKNFSNRVVEVNIYTPTQPW